MTLSGNGSPLATPSGKGSDVSPKCAAAGVAKTDGTATAPTAAAAPRRTWRRGSMRQPLQSLATPIETRAEHPATTLSNDVQGRHTWMDDTAIISHMSKPSRRLLVTG